jgi:hypothetical protein
MDFFDPVISKIRDSVKYIQRSQTQKEKFEEIVKQQGISYGRWPSLDTPTHWDSTHIMIDTAREYLGVLNSLAIQDKKLSLQTIIRRLGKHKCYL